MVKKKSSKISIILFCLSFVDEIQFIIFASALYCTAFAYPVYEEYQYAGHDLKANTGEASYESTGYHPLAAERIGVHELGGHEEEHVDYYVS